MNKLQLRIICFLSLFLSFIIVQGQNISGFRTATQQPDNSVITNRIDFNGYTNYWHDTYTNWFRYGNLFKIAMPDVKSNILQSKIDVAADLGLPGLLMQEGFLSNLFKSQYKILKNPSADEFDSAVKNGDVLVVTNPSSELGKNLEEKAASLFEWVNEIGSYQLKSADMHPIKAFYLIQGAKKLFVISSSSSEQVKSFMEEIETAKKVVDKYRMHKGLFGVSSLLKSVTIEQDRKSVV